MNYIIIDQNSKGLLPYNTMSNKSLEQYIITLRPASSMNYSKGLPHLQSFS